MPVVRAGGPSDLEEVLAIQAASPEASAWPPADYLAGDLTVAVQDGRVCGFLAARQVADEEFEILNVAVDPGCRRRGIGMALVDAYLATHFGAVYLEVRESNLEARNLYKKKGFLEAGKRPGYYFHPPEAAIVMKFHSC
jgi:ribosomal-protein-alanine N-acetyltransferase